MAEAYPIYPSIKKLINGEDPAAGVNDPEIRRRLEYLSMFGVFGQHFAESLRNIASENPPYGLIHPNMPEYPFAQIIHGLETKQVALEDFGRVNRTLELSVHRTQVAVFSQGLARVADHEIQETYERILPNFPNHDNDTPREHIVHLVEQGAANGQTSMAALLELICYKYHETFGKNPSLEELLLYARQSEQILKVLANVDLLTHNKTRFTHIDDKVENRSRYYRLDHKRQRIEFEQTSRKELQEHIQASYMPLHGCPFHPDVINSATNNKQISYIHAMWRHYLHAVEQAFRLSVA